MLNTFLSDLKQQPSAIEFSQTMKVIEANYQFNETEFKNGDIVNKAGQNSGSCKIFAFAQLHQLSQAETLNLFGDYYRKDVLEHPEADDHQNIRNFIQFGWQGIEFNGIALSPKAD
ncbi:HopJ type III effector protein [Catenovulum adriaticum]|uniref:HopJ type III effector protein n=1 Tax=Catenovulum adriaticum TaxID=2984846 RepID=A0ABY7AMZ6_9ALTE|nr:HopJ type III effector protein [Catenovulum sp. TS8]WAJ70933.1 HopJ type III effector protein [Catenovulum sp. TS8]